jgi:hypothetical protein
VILYMELAMYEYEAFFMPPRCGTPVRKDQL